MEKLSQENLGLLATILDTGDSGLFFFFWSAEEPTSLEMQRDFWD